MGVTSCKGLWKEELMVSALSLKTLVAIKGIERTFYFWKVILTHSFPFVLKNVISNSRPRQNEGNFEWLIMFFRAMKGEIDHITSKIETLEMNQETAHTVSTRSLSLSFLLIFLFLRSHCYRTVNLKWSGGTNNRVTEIRVAINAITSLIWHQTWMYRIGGSWITKYSSKIQNSETKSKFEIVNVKENMSTHQRLDDITVKVKEIRQLTGVRWDKKSNFKADRITLIKQSSSSIQWKNIGSNNKNYLSLQFQDLKMQAS